MAGPIGYTPPANPYSAMPIDPQSFHGLNPLPAMGAAQTAMAPLQAKIQQSEDYDTQASKAAKFQRLLQSGQEGMQAYIQDIGKTNPELAAQFTREFTSVAPHMQYLKGKELTDLAFNMYDSWNGRVGGSKVSSAISQDPNAPMPSLLGKMGGSVGAKDQLTLLGNDQLRQSTLKVNDAKVKDLENAPGLKIKLQQMKDNARVRAARYRATKDAKGAMNYQYTFNGASKNYEELTKQIDELTAEIAKDPTMAKYATSHPQELAGLRRERVIAQKAMQHAVEKGAKPDEYIGAPKDIDLGQMPDPGAETDSTSSAPTYTLPTTPTAQSTDAEIETYLRNYRDPNTGEKLIVTPELVKQARERL